MPTRTGYTDSNYFMDAPWANDGRDSNDYIYGDSSPTVQRLDGIMNLAYDYETLDSQYFVNPIIDRLNAGAAAPVQASLDSATNLISTLRIQLANAESGGGGAIQTWSS